MEIMRYHNSKEILDECARYKYVVENIKDVIWEVDPKAVFTFISPTIKAMTGYTPGEVVGRSILEFLTEDSKNYIRNTLNNPAKEERTPDHAALYDVEFICKDGRAIWCEVSVKPICKENHLVCYIGTTRDISDKKGCEQKLQELLESEKCINQQLEDTVTFDMLTGAYNRRKFEYFLGQEIEKAEKSGTSFAISIFDIDNFKRVNDVYGHNKGDRVLQEITALIKHALRAADKLFRWGGDEFIILFADVNLESVFKVATRIRETVQSYEFDIEDKTVTVSMGVGAYVPNETSDQFVARVDEALLRAKKKGKNLVELA